jgi:excisionase family DNA binding protein
VQDGAWEAGPVDELNDVEWLSLPEVAERLGCPLSIVRRMLAEGQLLAARRGENAALSVPSVLLGPEGPLPELPGTVTVLADNGVRGEEALEWLFAEDPSLVGGSPIGALLAGHKTEVRRRAQALG